MSDTIDETNRLQLAMARGIIAKLTQRLFEISAMAEETRLHVNDIPSEPGRNFDSACAVVRGDCMAISQLAMAGLPKTGANPPWPANSPELPKL